MSRNALHIRGIKNDVFELYTVFDNTHENEINFQNNIHYYKRNLKMLMLAQYKTLSLSCTFCIKCTLSYEFVVFCNDMYSLKRIRCFCFAP